jgi:hypothetical protein
VALILSQQETPSQGCTLTPILRNWVTEYEKINGTDMAESTIDAITSFMHDRAVEADAADLRNQMKQTSSQGHGRKKVTLSPKKVGRVSKYEFNKDSKSRGKIQAGDPCPFPNHNHKWGECYNNINNPEAHKRWKERQPGKSTGGSAKPHNHSTMANESESDGEHHAHQADGSNQSDNEPGFVDGKLNGYHYPVHRNGKVFLMNAGAHHLDCFFMQDLQQEVRKNTWHGDSSMKNIPRSPRSSGSHATVSKLAMDCMTAICCGLCNREHH